MTPTPRRRRVERKTATGTVYQVCLDPAASSETLAALDSLMDAAAAEIAGRPELGTVTLGALSDEALLAAIPLEGVTVDELLARFPGTHRITIWRALIRLRDEGLVRRRKTEKSGPGPKPDRWWRTKA